jgi:hypothetical protein
MNKKRNKATLDMHARAEKSRFFLLCRHQKPQAAHIQRQNTTSPSTTVRAPFPAGQPARTTEKKLGSENEATFLTTQSFSAALCTATPATLAALLLHLRHYPAPRPRTSLVVH